MLTWLLKIAGKEEYLASLGATPDIIHYIVNQPSAQYLVNEFRKNPRLTIEQLQAIQVPEKRRRDELTVLEQQAIGFAVGYLRRGLVNNWNIDYERMVNNFENWLTVEFRKVHASQQLIEHVNNNNQTVLMYAPQGLTSTIFEFPGYLNMMTDWIIAETPELASYSLHQALLASEDWHAAQAARGEGLEYEQTRPEAIVYGPNWNNPEWQGWTIQQVTSENDMLAEGNKQNHCIGNYCREVTTGSLRIFSLRDPKNEPHATIEFEGDAETVNQIQGNSNSEPKPVYKQMIKEWFSTIQNITLEYHEGYDWDRLNYVNNREIDERLEQIIYAGNEYGVRPDWSGFEAVDAYRALMKVFEGSRGDNGYYSWMGDSANILARAAHDHDKWYQGIATNTATDLFGRPLVIDSETGKMTWKVYERGSQVYALEQIMEENKNNATDSFYNYDHGLEWPDPEDYATEQEYDEAREQVEKYEQELMDESYSNYLPGAFDNVLWKELNRLQEEDPLYIPPYKQDAPGRVANRNWLQLIAEN